MKSRLLAILIIATISSCKKKYSYEDGPAPQPLTQKPKQLCNIIVDRKQINDTTGRFTLGDWGDYADIIVGIAEYNSYHLGSEYCNIPLCGQIAEKITFTSAMLSIRYVGYRDGELYNVIVPVTQQEYDKYNKGDYYCYTP